MELNDIPVLLVTANVGSIFQDPEFLLKTWVKEFLATVKKFQPQFLALHCQEVGGKSYEESMIYVQDFVRTLMASEELMNFGQVRVFLDEDYSCTEKFTALGNLYFIHNAIENVQIYDFQDLAFVPVVGKEVHSGNIEKVTTKEKAKFPKEFFPECKWSRKGFMRTRWILNGTTFDLINIHLFHDASNIVAMETFPSSYTKNRRHALEYTLRRFQSDSYGKAPFFIFGDFNFRLDTSGVIHRLTNKAAPILVKNPKNGEIVKVMYRDPTNDKRVLLTLEKKMFEVESHEDVFLRNSQKWLHEYDKELQSFRDSVFEYQISFHPSYPFREDAGGATSYMRTRCPSWCDRILLSKSAKSLVTNPEDNENAQVVYQLLGESVCMGDHKPVLLNFKLRPMAGRQYEFITDPAISEPLPKVPCRRAFSNPVELYPTINKNNVTNFWPNGDASAESREPLNNPASDAKPQHPPACRVASESALQGQSQETYLKKTIDKLKSSPFSLSRKSSRCTGQNSSSSSNNVYSGVNEGDIELVRSEINDERLSSPLLEERIVRDPPEVVLELNLTQTKEMGDIDANVEGKLRLIKEEISDDTVTLKSSQNDSFVSDPVPPPPTNNPALNSVSANDPSSNTSQRRNCFDCCVIL